VSAENEVPAGEIRLFDSQWSNIVNGETTVEGAVKATEKAMRRNFEDGAFPPPRAFFTKTITDLQSSLAEKDETIADLRARCEAAERDAVYFVTHLAEFIRGLTEDDQETYSWLDRRSALLSQADAFIAAQHAQRKEKGL
jgi:hypothetical protein